jgi:hypothetical protein
MSMPEATPRYVHKLLKTDMVTVACPKRLLEKDLTGSTAGRQLVRSRQFAWNSLK